MKLFFTIFFTLSCFFTKAQISELTTAETLKKRADSIIQNAEKEIFEKAQNLKKIKKSSTNFSNQKKINRKNNNGTNTFVIVYDFAKKIYDTNLVRPIINHPVIFKVININRVAYDVKISSRDSILAISEMPDGFEYKEVSKQTESEESESSEAEEVLSYATPDKNDVQAENDTAKEKIVNEIKEMKSESALQSEKIKLSQTLINSESEKQTIENEISILESRKKDVSGFDTLNIENTIKSKSEYKKDLEGKINSYKTRINEIDSQVSKIRITTSAIRLYGSKLTNLNFYYYKVVDEYRKIWDIFRINNQLVAISLQPILTVTDFQNACEDSAVFINQSKIKGFRNHISSFFRAVNDFNEQYSLLVNDYEIIRILTDEGVKKMQEYSRSLNSMVNRMLKNIRERDPNRIIDQMYHIYVTLTKPEAYQMVSAPIQPSKDLVIFDIEIKKKKNTEYRDDRTFSYREYVRGGLRYDFSTGIAFGFGVNDYTYSKVVNGDSAYINRNEKTNRYLPVITAMLHASIRRWSGFNVAFSLGASISTTELDINSLFPGISLMIGKGEKFIFTAGPAFKKINYLDSKYQLGKNYPSTEFPSDLISTTPTFRLGWFLGVSYNLTHQQKSNFKIGRN